MLPHDWDWEKELHDEASRLVGAYTPDKYPANIETQHEYDQAIKELESKYIDGLEKFHLGQRKQLDTSYPKLRLMELNQIEQEAISVERDRHAQLAIREGQRDERKALEDGKYRETERYKEEMQELVERQANDIERLRNLDQLAIGLDKRFGLSRDETPRPMPWEAAPTTPEEAAKHHFAERERGKRSF